MAEEDDLKRKYRPKSLEKMIGHSNIIKSLVSHMEKDELPQVLLFAGPSGTGKTTFARVVARHKGCKKIPNLLEIDAGTNNSVDDIRSIEDYWGVPNWGKNRNKFIIMDEVHMFSKSAWNALLKILEEPPPYLYFALCTTELNKVPVAIRNQRAQTYMLQPVVSTEILDFLKHICSKEKIKLTDDILEQISLEAYGSPRAALSFLIKCRFCKNIKQAQKLLMLPGESKEVIDLCRLLVNDKATWSEIVVLIQSLREVDPESTRILIVRYLISCVCNTKNNSNRTKRFLDILDAFSVPFNRMNNIGDILLAASNCVKI